MIPYLVKTPKFVQQIFPKRVWSLPHNKNSVFLTFDDGPITEITSWVLDQLKKHNAKGTFFCIGNNIQKNPMVFEKIISEGHTVGNHTFNHLNGWKTNTETYINNCFLFEKVLKQFKYDNSQLTSNNYRDHNSLLFRPPYGKITSKQSKILQQKGYKIVMWDILSADFDIQVSKEKSLQNILKYIQSGSIILFHDSLKAQKKLKYLLPKVLDYIKEKGFDCKAIE